LKQLIDYDKDLVMAVRNSDIASLRRMYSEGRNLSACNKFSESIVHMACRRADFEVVDYIVRHGGLTTVVDDYGRTPLHDACWRSEPQFDVVTLLLDRNIDLLRMVDVRGANALKYVCSDHWLQWCAYFYHQKDKYWPLRDQGAETRESVADPSERRPMEG
jgi:ankyrin repeat protein